MEDESSDHPDDKSMDESSQSNLSPKHKSSKKHGKSKQKRKRIHISDESDDGEKELYCICRSSVADQFMICCDQCEEWFHGPCVNITQTYARKIANYYCPLCISKDQSLEIQLKQPKVKKEKSKPEPIFNDFLFKENTSNKKSNDDLDGDYEKNLTDVSSDDDDEEFSVSVSKKKAHKPKSSKITTSKPKNSNKSKKKARKNQSKQKPKATTSKSKAKKRSTDKKSHDHRRGRRKTEKSDEDEEEVLRHCLGIGCMHSARKQSKYCSDECGILINIQRMMEILPQRVEQSQSSPSAADQIANREFEKIRREQGMATSILAELHQQEKELNELIVKAKGCLPYTQKECDNIVDNDPENDFNIHCPICSHEISTKQVLKHMEKCCNKIETRTSFSSTMPTIIDGQSVFCDTLNPINRTYCKRLRVLCPEHSREQKISDTEVCGCPLPPNEDPFTESVDKFCRILRKKCLVHYNWEKFRQAAIDSQKIQQWLKLDELLEREQKLIQTINNRHGVVSLLLHHTISNS